MVERRAATALAQALGERLCAGRPQLASVKLQVLQRRQPSSAERGADGLPAGLAERVEVEGEGGEAGDGVVTKKEWLDYYTGISSNIDNDDRFLLVSGACVLTIAAASTKSVVSKSASLSVNADDL